MPPRNLRVLRGLFSVIISQKQCQHIWLIHNCVVSLACKLVCLSSLAKIIKEYTVYAKIAQLDLHFRIESVGLVPKKLLLITIS